MVCNCVAIGCNNEHDARKAVSFHTFPFKRPKILELWIKAICRANWYPSKSSRLCGQHFVASDYVIKPGCRAKVLKPDAVPSVFSFPKHLLKEGSLPKGNIIKVVDKDSLTDTSMNHDQYEPMDDYVENSHSQVTLPATSAALLKPIADNIKCEMSLPITVDNVDLDLSLPLLSTTPLKTFVDNATQTWTEDKSYFLRRQVKTLKQKVKRRDKKISSMKQLISDISKRRYSHETLDMLLKNYCEKLF